MGFMDAYKRLEKLCGDVMDDDNRVTAYINEMQQTPGARLVDGWNEDLKQLKHCRWLRNKIAHDPDCTEANMCTPEDTQWIKSFHQRILNQTDPLAMYRKAKAKRVSKPKPQPKPIAKTEPKTRKKHRRGKIIWIVILVIFLALVIWTIWGNTALEMNGYTISSESLPESFFGYRIAHISDLHNAQMGDGNEKLLQMLEDARPDLIAITGDLIDSYNTDLGIALDFAEKAMKIAPCYYVPGNHESRIAQYGQLKLRLQELGVVVLENQTATLERDGESIQVVGVADPSFHTNYLDGDSAGVMKGQLTELVDPEAGFVLLLSHRPELLDVYAQCGVDLVLSGHAHGGQFRLPFVDGLYAPNQGWFPEYDGGQYIQNGTTMIVSRGIGNSVVPFRFNNRPEIILIELQ